MRSLTLFTIVILAVASSGNSRDAERDFTGHWLLDRESSNPGNLPMDPEPFLRVEMTDTEIRCASEIAGKPVKWSYALNGDETRHRAGDETRSSAIKWEGAALLVNTLVSGPQNYVVMDRWKLAKDRTTLTITRQVMRQQRQTEGALIFRRASE